MRITGGTARGRVVRVPDGGGVRPTSSRVREALFSMVGQDLSGERVLDAFGGSGLLGLEAWSRGADVVIVEQRGKIARQIQEAAKAVGADLTVRTGDVGRWGAELGPFDGILADPPYAQDPEAWVARLGAWATSWLVFEADARHTAPRTAGALVLDREKRFGDTALWVYREAA